MLLKNTLSNRFLSRSAVLFQGVLFSVILSACTSVKVAELEPEAVVDDANANTIVSQLESDFDIPDKALDANTLEQLLLTNLASYQGKWSDAGQNALSVAEVSKDPRLARMATLLALRGDDYEVAARSAKLWYELADGSEHALSMRIISEVGAGQVSTALESLKAHSIEKELESHIKQAAGLLVRQPNREAALKIVEHYVSEHSDSAQVLLSSAYVAESFEYFDSAGQWISKALELKPNWDLAAQMKANLLRRTGDMPERAEFIAEFIRVNPKSVMMRINYAAELARDKKYQEALSLMQVVLGDAPKNAAALSYAAALASQLEYFDLAKGFYARVLVEDPRDDNARWSLARLAVIDEKYRKAEQLFGDITSDELSIDAQIQVANMRYQIEGLTSAVDTLRAIEPSTEAQYVEIALTRHYLLMQDHEHEEAFGHINETLIYLPDNLELVYARALVAAEINKVDVAEKDFKKIITVEPEHANALNALGYTLADQTDRYEEAKGYVEAALALRPEDAHILDSMGWVFYRLNEFDKAIEFLARAFKASPQVEIAAHLGEVYWESGQLDKANIVWQESFFEEPNNPVLNMTLERYGVIYSEQAK